MRLEGKVALVTGATGGMGSASARLFAREGAAVLVAARHEELADPMVQEITRGRRQGVVCALGGH